MDLEHIKRLSPDEFETYSALWWNSHYKGKATVTHKGPKGGDQGIDLEIRDEKTGEIFELGQCKRYTEEYNAPDKVDKIPKEFIEKFKCDMEIKKVKKGVFFSTLEYDQETWRRAKKLGIFLIPPKDLEK
ncbi:hypothetical protein CSB37_02975 [bacterium DOLZORAL124_38_8]|nr:MAG: hypothetical protein CSB37_02975 [bacterium DOLZORAL124_38_8]